MWLETCHCGYAEHHSRSTEHHSKRKCVPRERGTTLRRSATQQHSRPWQRLNRTTALMVSGLAMLTGLIVAVQPTMTSSKNGPRLRVARRPAPISDNLSARGVTLIDVPRRLPWLAATDALVVAQHMAAGVRSPDPRGNSWGGRFQPYSSFGRDGERETRHERRLRERDERHRRHTTSRGVTLCLPVI